MAGYDEDVFPGNSRYSSKRSSSRKASSSNGRRSPSAARGTSLAEAYDDDAGHGMHSLAHELAYALMPESGGSKLLAEELGIEYDEGAQGIDETEQTEDHVAHHNDGESLAEAFGSAAHHPQQDDYDVDTQPEFDPAFDIPSKPQTQTRIPEQDPMTVLAEDLESTDQFIAHLRRLDAEHSSQPKLEILASDMIRRIDETVREREGQVRELLEYEREFRRIAGEIGGTDALSQLDELDDLVSEGARPDTAASQETRSKPLDSIREEAETSGHTADWEADLDRDRARIEEDDYETAINSPPLTKTSFTVPTVDGPPTPKVTVTQLSHLRTFTTTVASSLATISEHTQVNSAATTEAGRKIRALKNKMGGWRAEWDSAERSRAKIEKWEAGLDTGESTVVVVSVPSTPTRTSRSRVDGRAIVKEHLEAFERALLEANTRTQAIIAAVS